MVSCCGVWSPFKESWVTYKDINHHSSLHVSCVFKKYIFCLWKFWLIYEGCYSLHLNYFQIKFYITLIYLQLNNKHLLFRKSTLFAHKINVAVTFIFTLRHIDSVWFFFIQHLWPILLKKSSKLYFLNHDTISFKEECFRRSFELLM